jgi:predicted Zn-dependent protease
MHVLNLKQSLKVFNKNFNYSTLNAFIKNFQFANISKKNYSEIKHGISKNEDNFDNMKLIKEKIKLVDIDEVGIDTVEHWTDQIVYFLDKENFKKFEESTRYLKRKNVPLTVNEINKFLPLIYNKSSKSVDILVEYIREKNLKLDSIAYHYLILSALKFKTFAHAFDLFVEASIFGVVQNLTVITSLLVNISKMPKDECEKYKSMVEGHYEKYYTKEDIE